MSAVVLPCCLLLQLAAAVTHGGCGNQRGFLEGWAREEMCSCHWQLCLVGAGLIAGSKVRPFDLGREVTLTGVISSPSCPEEGFPRSCHQLPVELSGRTHRSGSSRAVCLGSLCFFNYLEQSVNYKKGRPRGYSFPYQCTKPRGQKEPHTWDRIYPEAPDFPWGFVVHFCGFFMGKIHAKCLLMAGWQARMNGLNILWSKYILFS